jgi:hypothetical protein
MKNCSLSSVYRNEPRRPCWKFAQPANVNRANHLRIMALAFVVGCIFPSSISAQVTWTSRNSGTPKSLGGVASGNGVFVAVGASLTALTSTDGVNWTPQFVPTIGTVSPSGTTDLNAIAFGKGSFIAVSPYGSNINNFTWNSPDGVNWKVVNGGNGTHSTYNYKAVGFGNGHFVEVGGGDFEFLITCSGGVGTEYSSGHSIDGGFTWGSGCFRTPTIFNGVAFGNGVWVRVAPNGVIESSPEVPNPTAPSNFYLTWFPSNSGTAELLSAVTFGVGQFVVVGSSGTIRTSLDGLNWTTQSSGTTNLLSGVGFGNGEFVAVGSGGIILTSSDGSNWTKRTSGTSNFLRAATYGNGQYVVVGDNGTILTAPAIASPPVTNGKLQNISTRGLVGTGDNALIGGFIVSGDAAKVIVRAIGPSLSGIVPGVLQDTLLELHDGSGSLILANDDWRTTQEQQIIDTTVPPKDDRESAIVATLNPGNYTAIVRGKGNTTGVALVEVYGLQ